MKAAQVTRPESLPSGGSKDNTDRAIEQPAGFGVIAAGAIKLRSTKTVEGEVARNDATSGVKVNDADVIQADAETAPPCGEVLTSLR